MNTQDRNAICSYLQKKTTKRAKRVALISNRVFTHLRPAVYKNTIFDRLEEIRARRARDSGARLVGKKNLIDGCSKSRQRRFSEYFDKLVRVHVLPRYYSYLREKMTPQELLQASTLYEMNQDGSDDSSGIDDDSGSDSDSNVSASSEGVATPLYSDSEESSDDVMIVQRPQKRSALVLYSDDES